MKFFRRDSRPGHRCTNYMLAAEAIDSPWNMLIGEPSISRASAYMEIEGNPKLLIGIVALVFRRFSLPLYSLASSLKEDA